MSRIMHITQCLGGVETYLASFHAHGAFDGFAHRSLVLPEECALTAQWRLTGGEVHLQPMQRSVDPRHDVPALLALYRLLRRQKPDVLHLHSSKAGALGRMAAWLCRLRGQRIHVVYTPHAYYFLGQRGWKRRVYIGVERMLGWLTDSVLATSESEAVRSVQEVALPQRKVTTVANAVSIPPQREVSRAQGRDAFTVVFAGRICAQKNLDLLADVMARFSASEGIRFQLIGAGHYPRDRAVLDALLQHHDVAPDLVEIVPWLPADEVLARFAAADACMVTSRYESFGYVAAEAAAAGLPVLATRVDGLKDIVRDGLTGFLLELDDVEGFATGIRGLKASPEMAALMGSCGRERMAEHFNIVTNATAMRMFYEHCL